MIHISDGAKLLLIAASMYASNADPGHTPEHPLMGHSVMRSNSTLSANSLSGSTASTVTADAIGMMDHHSSYGAEDDMHDIALSDTSGPPTMSYSADMD